MSIDKSGIDWTGHMEPPTDVAHSGGHVPPINPLGVRAVVSEGEAWVDAAALNRYGAAFFEKLGGIPAANVHPVPDAGAVPLDVRKLSHVTYVSTELLEEYTRAPSPEDVARWRADEEARQAQRAREDARHAQLLATGGVVAAVAGLHSPDDARDCKECQDGDFMTSWPCTTWNLLDEQAPR